MSILSAANKSRNLEYLKLLIALVCPLGQPEVLPGEQGFEVYTRGNLVGKIWPHGEGWGVSRVGSLRIRLSEVENEQFERVTSGYATLPDAVRELFDLGGHPPAVSVKANIDGPLDGHNVTMQGVCDVVSFSVATHVSVPEEVAHNGSEAVGRYLHEVLTAASAAAPGLSFNVKVGLARI